MLTGGEENLEHEHAVLGEANLYVYSEPEERVRFVARLFPSDEEQWVQHLGFANVTPDGRFLVFTSHRALTADVTRENPEEIPAQVYRYDAETEVMTRQWRFGPTHRRSHYRPAIVVCRPPAKFLRRGGFVAAGRFETAPGNKTNCGPGRSATQMRKELPWPTSGVGACGAVSTARPGPTFRSATARWVSWCAGCRRGEAGAAVY